MSHSQTRRHVNGRLALAVLVAGGLAATIGVTMASGASHSHAKSVVISTFKSAKFGTVLSDGRTLYTLKPNAVACTATCHKYWTPVLLPKGVTKATAGAGVSAAKLGSRKITGGVQVTYNGRALFWFFEDKSAGQVKGNVTDTWGKWSDVVLKAASRPSTTTTQPATTTTVKSGPTPTTQPVTTTTVKSAPTPTTTSPGGGGGGGGGF